MSEQHPHGRTSNGDRELGRQFSVRQTADTVGAKERSH
jgi:hypothetical protein